MGGEERPHSPAPSAGLHPQGRNVSGAAGKAGLPPGAAGPEGSAAHLPRRRERLTPAPPRSRGDRRTDPSGSDPAPAIVTFGRDPTPGLGGKRKRAIERGRRSRRGASLDCQSLRPYRRRPQPLPGLSHPRSSGCPDIRRPQAFALRAQAAGPSVADDRMHRAIPLERQRIRKRPWRCRDGWPLRGRRQALAASATIGSPASHAVLTSSEAALSGRGYRAFSG